ncbi:MAG: 16S rRNA (guanine(527)-N(7))-methyltransferase RsmG [Candidatus Borkfalkiaceae bacterium]|nr:16S rRNA (guanine(527)-N(7))-methyltransferase RsmG [Christensenellaceae bacterium]
MSKIKEEKINLIAKQEEKFEKFCKILKEYNEKFNLTSITDDDGIYEKHFTDSLKGEEFFPLNAEVIEIGSGGGFPSVPLKIARDDLSFTLLEATEKKCGYLRIVGKELGFDNFNVICGRAEEFGKKEEFREKFDVATARAVARLNVLCEYCLPFVKKGGYFVAYKGDAEEEIKEAEKAVEILGGKIVEIKDFVLSEKSGRRNIIVIKKQRETPSEYPRLNGAIKKKPL